MPLAVLCEQFPRRIKVCVLANTGENVENVASSGLRILDAVRRQDRQSIMRGKIDKLPVDPLFTAQEVPLNFNVNIFASERVDKKLGVVGGIPGNARVSRAGDGVLAIANFLKRLFRRDAKTNMRDACATQQCNQTLTKFRQLFPLHCAFSFFTAQMRLGQQLTQIFVTGAILDQDWQNGAVFHREFATDDRANVLFARSHGKPLPTVNAIAIEQRQRRHLQFGRGFR